MSPSSLSQSSKARINPTDGRDHDQTQSAVRNSPDDFSEQEEEQPPHTAEIGTLKKLSVAGGTAWLGSSSGVYFVNTVRRAFSAAFAATSTDQDGDPVPASEDIITGEDSAGRSVNCATGTGNSVQRPSQNQYEPDFIRRIVTSVGRPPTDGKLAMDLVTTFFNQTHPLFPFLHGPTFLANMNEIYAAMAHSPSQTSSSTTGKQGNKSQLKSPKSSKSSLIPSNRRTNPTSAPDQSLGSLSSVDPLKIITFQIIINIAALSQRMPPKTTTKTKFATASHPLPPSSIIPSAHSLLNLILPLSTTPLLPTIQLLLAAELYLLSTISLRHSSTVAGLVLRLIYHVGLHRCPLRYASLTPQDCEIRKRIFWSAYALDRHLSLALGDPNTFQDSDIDVCLSRSGEGELHRAVARELLGDRERGDEWRMHYPRDASGRIILGDVDSSEHHPNKSRPKSQQQKQKGSRDDVNNPLPNTIDANTNIRNDNNATQQVTDTTTTKYTGRTTDINSTKSKTTSENTKTNNPPPRHIAIETPTSLKTRQLREAALTAYVQYGKLTGRIIEIFHKSINFRFPKQDAIGYLTADIENWWNDLPSTLTGDYIPPTKITAAVAAGNSKTPNSKGGDGAHGHDRDEAENQDNVDLRLVQQHRLLTPFFTLLYHQLLLLLNRPRLSLDQGMAEFQQGLQVCIRASRSTLTALRKHEENGQSMFLPGLLSAAWMSGLIIAFACQLGKYPKQRACGDLKSCLLLLELMNLKWYTVKNIHKVLSLLLANITSRKANLSGYLSASRDEVPSSGGIALPKSPSQTGPVLRRRKRRYDSTLMEDENETQPSTKRESFAGTSPASSEFRHFSHFNSPDIRPVTGKPSRSSPHIRNDSSLGGSSIADTLLEQSPTFTPSDFDVLNSEVTLQYVTGSGDANPTGISNVARQSMGRNQQRAGAALYADPQDMAFAQSNHSMGLPELSSFLDDQMFWGNMDSNLFDVFGAVSWESMTGPAGPMVTNPNDWDTSAFKSFDGGGGEIGIDSTNSADILMSSEVL